MLVMTSLTLSPTRFDVSLALFCAWNAVSEAVSAASLPPTRERFTELMAWLASSRRRFVLSCASRLASFELVDIGEEKEEGEGEGERKRNE